MPFISAIMFSLPSGIQLRQISFGFLKVNLRHVSADPGRPTASVVPDAKSANRAGRKVSMGDPPFNASTPEILYAPLHHYQRSGLMMNSSIRLIVYRHAAIVYQYPIERF
jgi:hypothetical protein